MANKRKLQALRDAVRRHRDQRGDDRCWLDDEELYRHLPEGYDPPKRDTAVELDNCRKYLASRQNPKTEYDSPQRRIEELEKALEALKADLTTERRKGRLDASRILSEMASRFPDSMRVLRECQRILARLGAEGGAA